MNCTKCGKEFAVNSVNMTELAARLQGVNPSDINMQIMIKCKDCLEEEEKDAKLT